MISGTELQKHTPFSATAIYGSTSPARVNGIFFRLSINESDIVIGLKTDWTSETKNRRWWALLTSGNVQYDNVEYLEFEKGQF